MEIFATRLLFRMVAQSTVVPLDKIVEGDMYTEAGNETPAATGRGVFTWKVLLGSRKDL